MSELPAHIKPRVRKKVVGEQADFPKRLSLATSIINTLLSTYDFRDPDNPPRYLPKAEAKVTKSLVSMIERSTFTFGWSVRKNSLIAPSGIEPSELYLPEIQHLGIMVEWRSVFLVSVIQFCSEKIIAPHIQPILAIPDFTHPLSSFLHLHGISCSVDRKNINGREEVIVMTSGSIHTIPTAMVQFVESRGIGF